MDNLITFEKILKDYKKFQKNAKCNKCCESCNNQLFRQWFTGYLKNTDNFPNPYKAYQYIKTLCINYSSQDISGYITTLLSILAIIIALLSIAISDISSNIGIFIFLISIGLLLVTILILIDHCQKGKTKKICEKFLRDIELYWDETEITSSQS